MGKTASAQTVRQREVIPMFNSIDDVRDMQRLLDEPNVNPEPTFSVGYMCKDTGEIHIYKQGLSRKEADAEIAKNGKEFPSFKTQEVSSEAKEPV
jgi:hypothetical protein